MSYRSHTAAPERLWDHLYDPLYHSSSARNILAKNYRSLRRSAPIAVYPVYQSMFSELMQDTRNRYVLLQNPIPFHREDGGGDACNAEVSGIDRAKYFSNPMSNIKTVNVRLAEEPTGIWRIKTGPRVQSRGCQTLYRESSAQTLPWMPEAILAAGCPETPEIVQVAELIDGIGYPGIREVEIIERAREKRMWENQLPFPRTADEWERKRLVMEAFEWDQWTQREAEIDKCQRMRYRMVLQMIAEREEQNRMRARMKLENSSRRLEEERDRKIDKLRIRHQRSIRKLEKKHRAIRKKPKKDGEFDDFIETITIQIPARPLASPGYSAEFEPEYLSRTDSKPLNLEKFMRPKETLWTPKKEVKESQRGLWSDKVLSELYDSLKLFREQTEIQRKLPECLEQIQSPTESITESPAVPGPDPNESQYQNAIIIQKFIKGRAIQNLIYHGKDECRELIEDFRVTNQLESIQHLFPKEPDTGSEIEPEPESEEPADEPSLQEAKAEAQSDRHIGYTLDFLSKELARLQEERKSHAMFMLAERERLKREAFEASQREKETTQRRECEEIYRNVFKAEHDVVTTYLENVLLEGINQISEEEARQKIREMAEKIDQEAQSSLEDQERFIESLVSRQIVPEIISKIPPSNLVLVTQIIEDLVTSDALKRLPEFQDTEICPQEDSESLKNFMNDVIIPKVLKKVADENLWSAETSESQLKITSDLVQEFIAPEVFKILTRERFKRARQPLLLAAHDAIWTAAEEIPEDPDTSKQEPTESEPDPEKKIACEEADIAIAEAIDRALDYIELKEGEQQMAAVENLLVQQEEEDSDDESFDFQKELLEKIVGDLNAKLKQQAEEERERATSKGSIDVIVKPRRGSPSSHEEEE